METTPSARTMIAEDIEITGSIKCASDIEISGKLNGDLNCVGTAVIGEKAVIKGNITANLISVRGQISGNITVKDRIELKSTARLTGDIRAKRLTVEDGVTFVGKSEVNPTGSGATRPEDAASATERNTEPEVVPEVASGDNRNKSGVFTRR